MHTLSVLSFILPALLSRAATVEPRTTYEFDITALSASLPVDGVYGTGPRDAPISITVTYPDPSSTSGGTLSTTCDHLWPASTPPSPFEWTPCADPALQWHLPADGWTNAGNYRVDLYQTLEADG